MNITLYNQTSDTNKLDKTLGTGTSVIGTIKDESNVVNPTIILSKDVTENFNYFYIQQLHRFYYVTDKTLEHGRTVVNGHVDVLMSFNAQIKNMNVIAERASTNYNLYQEDREIPMLNYNVIATKAFTNGFTTASYVLGTFGG